jgi:hypothetical protein
MKPNTEQLTNNAMTQENIIGSKNTFKNSEITQENTKRRSYTALFCNCKGELKRMKQSRPTSKEILLLIKKSQEDGN